MSTVRRMLAGTVLGAAAVGLLGISPASAGETSEYSGTRVTALAITHITCVKQEDENGADDAYLVINGSTIWGPTQMTKGDSKDISGVGMEPGQVLTLMEGDWPDADDNLGALKIDGPGVYQFHDDGADYWITVK